jgi:hypothetical protein
MGRWPDRRNALKNAMPQLKTRRNEERNYYSSGKQTRYLAGDNITMIFYAMARLVNWQPAGDFPICSGTARIKMKVINQVVCTSYVQRLCR